MGRNRSDHHMKQYGRNWNTSKVVSMHTPEILDGHGSLSILEYVQQHPRPVATVAQLPQVRQRFFRGAKTLLYLGEFIAESNEKFPIAFPLVRRERENAGNIVILRTFLFLNHI